MKHSFKARNIIFIIVVIGWILFFLWQGYKWRQEYIRQCTQDHIQIDWRITD